MRKYIIRTTQQETVERTYEVYANDEEEALDRYSELSTDEATDEAIYAGIEELVDIKEESEDYDVEDEDW